VVSTTHPQNFVISTEGGAFAAVVERSPHFVFAVACFCLYRRPPACKIPSS
jgi:hypothetical protein